MDGLVATADGTRRVATKFHAAADGHSTIGRGRAHIELTRASSGRRSKDFEDGAHRQVKSRKEVCVSRKTQEKNKKSLCVVLFLPRSSQVAVRDGAPPRPPLDKFWETMWP